MVEDEKITTSFLVYSVTRLTTLFFFRLTSGRGVWLKLKLTGRGFTKYPLFPVYRLYRSFGLHARKNYPRHPQAKSIGGEEKGPADIKIV